MSNEEALLKQRQAQQIKKRTITAIAETTPVFEAYTPSAIIPAQISVEPTVEEVACEINMGQLSPFALTPKDTFSNFIQYAPIQQVDCST